MTELLKLFYNNEVFKEDIEERLGKQWISSDNVDITPCRQEYIKI